MGDPPMRISWRKPNSSGNGENSHDSALTVMNMMLPIRELRPFEDPSKLYPWVWLTQCEFYFSSHRIPNSLWLENATPLLRGEAKVWFDELLSSKKRRKVSWEVFRYELCEKFGDEDPVDVFRRYREIQQKERESSSSYSDRFFRISNLVQSFTRGDRERYFLLLFISGMNDDIQYMVRLLEPTCTDDAFQKGLRAEKYIETMKKNISGGS